MIQADTMQGIYHGRVIEVVVHMGTKNFLTFIIGILFVQISNAQIPRLLYRQSPELFQTVVFLPELKLSDTWTKKDIETVVPYQTFTPQMQTTEVMKKIADKSFQQIINRPQFQNSTLGRFTTQMKDYFKFELNLNSLKSNEVEKSSNPPVVALNEPLAKKSVMTPNDWKAPEIEHKLQFNYAAFESRAEFKYTGWTEAVLNYELVTSKSEVQIRKNIFHNKQLFLSHVGTKTAEANSMGVRWGF